MAQEEEMAKGNTKNNSSGDSLAPAQPRSLRLRKRECPSDEIYETDDAQAPLHHQESAMTSAGQHQTAEQDCLNKKDPSTEEKHAETVNVSLKNEMLFVEEQEETTVTISNNDSQLGCRVPDENYANQNGKVKEEIPAKESDSSTSQTRTEQLQVLSPGFEEDDGLCVSALEVKLGAKENSQLTLERNQESSCDDHSNVCVAEVKEVTKGAESGLPTKKKRRMGMCGLTEKERSHFLQTQKRENGQNELERPEDPICNDIAALVAQNDTMSSPSLPSSQYIPADRVTEQAEMKLHSSHCGGDDRADTEVHTAVTTSDGTSSSKVNGCEAERSVLSEPEQTGDTKSGASAEEQLLGNPEQEPEENKADRGQRKDGGDESSLANQNPAISFDSNPIPKETEDCDEVEAAPLQVTSTTGGKMEELTCDAEVGDRAEAGASSTDTLSGRFTCGSVELCAAESFDPEDKPVDGPDTLISVDPQTDDTTDPFGSGCLDYVSDSQLNTITLTEEEVMETMKDDLGSTDCHDATDLICGLIRELSSLNQRVMATHRELENLRRPKSSRSSTR